MTDARPPRRPEPSAEHRPAAPADAARGGGEPPAGGTPPPGAQRGAAGGALADEPEGISARAPRGSGTAPGEDRTDEAAAPVGTEEPTGGARGGKRAGRRVGLLATFVLGCLTALPALSMDMYLPALPEIGAGLGTAASQVQLTLTACLIGLAVGQLVVGPMSDRFGRRRPLLIGMTGYVVASLACVFAPTVEVLFGFRLLQGLSGAAGIVIARAVVRDTFDGLSMARFFSTLMLISGVAPILAPVLGGQVLRFTDWRGVFVVLTVIGFALVLVVLRWLPETLPPSARHTGGLADALRTMRALLADRVFSGYLLAGSFAFGALFSYVSASPFVVQEIYGASPQTFSLLFMGNSVGLILFGQINGRLLVGRVPLDRVLAFGLCLTGCAAIGLLVMVSGVFGTVGLVPLAVGLCVLMSGMGLVMPNANSQGLMRTPHAAGSASALLGTAQFLIGACVSPLVGVAGEETALPMALVQLSSLGVAAAAFLGLCRPWRTRA
ncbi:multidrug effflux MFS transporter [Streptomyces xiaopingdaonensis]|uniref:multidrug effflux MFS transporter n=1 Tax=Streptomyces xiaopingdaonensis TaxID=1565415 RepID=UPI0002DFD421|nr:multidrug effflux MFS transporter [Streptomyces xiaopingdaonensis]